MGGLWFSSFRGECRMELRGLWRRLVDRAAK